MVLWMWYDSRQIESDLRGEISIANAKLFFEFPRFEAF